MKDNFWTYWLLRGGGGLETGGGGLGSGSLLGRDGLLGGFVFIPVP